MSQKRSLSRPETESPTRMRILAAAERLFAEDGYGGVSMPAIAAASGITAGAIYKHFDSKEDLFFHCVRRAIEAARLATQRTPDGGTDLPRAVASYTTSQLKRVRQYSIEMHAASMKHPKVRRLLRAGLAHNIEQIRGGIAAAQDAGLIDPAADATMLARALLVFIMGLMHMETLLPDLVDDAAWYDFVEARAAALLGLRMQEHPKSAQ